MATGKKREGFSTKLYVGNTEGEVVAINPSVDEMKTLGLPVREDADEIDYVKDKDITLKDPKTDKEITKTVKQARVDIWFKYIGKDSPGGFFKKSYFVTDTPMKNKAGDKLQYVNQVGESDWKADESLLRDTFKYFRKKMKDNSYTNIGDKAYRVAVKGEADLLGFVRTWLSEFDYYDIDTNIMIDMKSIFKGNFKELQEQVGGEYAKTTVENIQIRTSSDDGKQYMSVWKTSLPGWMIKEIRGKDFSEAALNKMKKEAWSQDNKDGRNLKAWEKLALDLNDPDYGSSDFFTMDLLKEYSEDDNPVSGDGALVGADDEDDSDDSMDY